MTLFLQFFITRKTNTAIDLVHMSSFLGNEMGKVLGTYYFQVELCAYAFTCYVHLCKLSSALCMIAHGRRAPLV